MIKINSIKDYDLVHYALARIDIKNSGNENNKIEILHKSDDVSIFFPKWYKQEDGEGVVIQGFKGKFNLIFKCINDGQLNIRLRGIDARDNEGNVISIFTNFINMSINGKSIFEDEKLVSHNNFFNFNEFNVKDNDVIHFHVEWEPFKVLPSNNPLIFAQSNNDLISITQCDGYENMILNKQCSSNLFGNSLPKVSVIIPVYNPGELLRNCLDSVINQSLANIEIICVDDGSTDNSLDILNEYAKKDSRIKIYTQNNKGAGTARNKGIEKSNGEYIIFLDSDDWIEKDMCEQLYNHANKLGSDLVIFDSLWHTLDGINEFNYFSKGEFNEDYQSFTFDYHYILNRLLIASYGVIWSRFYKSSYIKDNEIIFPKHKIYNDVEFCFKTAFLAKNISYYPKPFYHYIKMGQPSLQTSFREGKDELIWFDVLLGLYDMLIEYDLMDELRVDFINYCIFYTFEKLKHIDLKLFIPFLHRSKSFFEVLNPTSEELNLISSLNLTWYTANTLDYLPLYYEVMLGNFDDVVLIFLEVKLSESKKALDESSFECKENLYRSLRKNLIDFNYNQDVLKNLPLELYDFYRSVINFNTYHDFGLVNKKIIARTNTVQDILWQDINNSKDVSEYTIYEGHPGKLELIENYKQLKILSSNPIVVRAFSKIVSGDLELLFEVKVTDYANVGLSSSENVQKFAFLRISNQDWLYYRFLRINGNVDAYVSFDGANWEKINLTGNTLNNDECQFQFNCGYSKSHDKRIMIRNIQIFKI